MSEYSLVTIDPSDREMNARMDALLKQEGIERDGNLDYSVGLADENYNLLATGSCFKNSLRCLAVDSGHRGEGLMNEIVSHLTELEYERGNLDLFLYTKCDKEAIFADLGFHRIARVEGKLVFMENRKDGFRTYLDRLKKETGLCGKRQSAVVMNANPFTLGHRALLEKAAASSDLVHVFVVSEDCSAVPFAVRKKLVEEGSRDLKNLVFHESGSYMISAATFPSYFLKDADTVIYSHAKLDTAVFIKIAEALRITERFAGEEPFSHVTKLYNEVMAEGLQEAGIRFTVMHRKEADGRAVSASEVRKLIAEGKTEEIRPLVPESTYRYFSSKEAEPVIRKIRGLKNPVHY